MRRLAIALAPALSLLACASHPKVLVPPQYDLRGYPAVGLLEFSTTTARGERARYATQQFLEQIQEAQPGVRVLELGPADAALSSVGRPTLDAAAVVALGQRHRVAVLFAGSLEIADAQAKVNVGAMLNSLGLSTQVRATLTGRLLDAATGATIWTRTASDVQKVAGLSVSGGAASIGMDNPDNVYGRMVRRTVYSVTDPFRAHWMAQ